MGVRPPRVRVGLWWPMAAVAVAALAAAGVAWRRRTTVIREHAEIDDAEGLPDRARPEDVDGRREVRPRAKSPVEPDSPLPD